VGYLVHVGSADRVLGDRTGADGHADTDSHAHADGHADTDGNCDGHRHRYNDAFTNADPDPDGHADSDPHSYSRAYPHTHASAAVRLRQRFELRVRRDVVDRDGSRQVRVR